MNSTENILARAARQLVDDPHVIAAALATHQAREEVEEAAVADWLGISVERLHGLALCTRPDPHDPFYVAEVDAIARYIGCDANRLHAILAGARTAT